MQAKHLTLLWAFASGGLSSALILGPWHDTDSSAPVAQSSRVDAAKPERAPARGEAQKLAKTAPSSSPASHRARDDEPTPSESGSSVADVLSRLEAAYQKELGTKEPVSVAPPAEPALPERASSAQPELDARSESGAAEPVRAEAPHVAPTPTEDHTPMADASTARNDAPVIASAAETTRSAAALTATDDAAVAQPPTDPGTAVTASAFERPDVYQLQQLLLLQYIQLVVLPPGEHRAATRPHHTPRWPHTAHAAPRALPWGHPTFPAPTTFPGTTTFPTSTSLTGAPTFPASMSFTGATNPWQQTHR